MKAQIPDRSDAVLAMLCRLERLSSTRRPVVEFLSDHPTNDNRIKALFGPEMSLDNCPTSLLQGGPPLWNR